MPAEDDSVLISNVYVSKEWILKELLLDKSRIVVLDCRSSNEYCESHIRDAVNFCIPSIIMRRLAGGTIDLASTIRSKELKEKIVNAYRDNIFVVYGDVIDQRTCGTNDIVHVLIRRLLKDGCRAVCLQDGFTEFRRAYPEWCEACNELLESPNLSTDVLRTDSNVTIPLVGISTLQISRTNVTLSRQRTPALPSSSTEDSSSEPELLDDEDRDFPVEIVPFLYLGNAANSEDLDALSRHGIRYILNVTPDLPNRFENVTKFKYMQIPITDHWTQNLACFFPEAIQFIDEGRSQKIGVLVHCLAGVSRSVTITLAYLMSRMRMSLNDAFCLVRSRKSNVGPNFYFMEQLLAFERELLTETTNSASSRSSSSSSSEQKSSSSSSTESADGTGDESAISSAALTVFGQSPDSGIEFDRWTPGTGE